MHAAHAARREKKQRKKKGKKHKRMDPVNPCFQALSTLAVTARGDRDWVDTILDAPTSGREKTIRVLATDLRLYVHVAAGIASP